MQKGMQAHFSSFTAFPMQPQTIRSVTCELPNTPCVTLPSTPWLPPGLSEWMCVAQHGLCPCSEAHHAHCMTDAPHNGNSSYFLGTKSRAYLHSHVGLCQGGGEGVGNVLWQREAPSVGGSPSCREGNGVWVRSGICGWLWVLRPM